MGSGDTMEVVVTENSTTIAVEILVNGVRAHSGTFSALEADLGFRFGVYHRAGGGTMTVDNLELADSGGYGSQRTVIKSVGITTAHAHAAHTYGSITDAESALDRSGNILVPGDNAVLEIYNEGGGAEGGAYDELVMIKFNQNLSSVTFTVPAGERHNGTAGTGARLRPATREGEILQIFTTARVVGLEIDGSGVTPRASAIGVFVDGRAATNTVLEQMLIHGVHASGRNATAAGIHANTVSNTVIKNTIVYDIAGQGTDSSGFGIDGDYAGNNTTAYNCTVFNVRKTGNGTGRGFRLVLVKNSVAAHTADLDFEDPIAGSDFNASEDGTAPGTNSLIHQTLEALSFADTTSDSENLHLNENSVLIDRGVNLLTLGVTDDIDNLSRPIGAAYDIGADERDLPEPSPSP